LNAEGCLLSAAVIHKPCLSLCQPVHLGLTCVALPHVAIVWPNPPDTDAATADATDDANEYELDDDELLALAATQLDGS